MRRYDASCKFLVEHYPLHLIQMVGLPGKVEWLESMPLEIAAPEGATDAVLHFCWQGVEMLLHLEFETTAKGDLPQRVFWYNGTRSASFHKSV